MCVSTWNNITENCTWISGTTECLYRREKGERVGLKEKWNRIRTFQHVPFVNERDSFESCELGLGRGHVTLIRLTLIQSNEIRLKTCQCESRIFPLDVTRLRRPYSVFPQVNLHHVRYSHCWNYLPYLFICYLLFVIYLLVCSWFYYYHLPYCL